MISLKCLLVSDLNVKKMLLIFFYVTKLKFGRLLSISKNKS